MKTSLLFALMLLFAQVAGLLANPIAIDSEERFCTMTYEKVLLKVKADHSVVTGEYRFRLNTNDPTPEAEDKYVRIVVPVVVSSNGGYDFERLWGRPKLSINGQEYECDETDRSTPVDPAESKAAGVQLRYCKARIPLQGLKSHFVVSLSYIQPHLPSRTAVYVPIHPPAEGQPAEVTFEASSGFALQGASGLSSILNRKADRLSFRPKNGQMLKVRALRV